jgi:hypothetical protein
MHNKWSDEKQHDFMIVDSKSRTDDDTQKKKKREKKRGETEGG